MASTGRNARPTTDSLLLMCVAKDKLKFLSCTIRRSAAGGGAKLELICQRGFGLQDDVFLIRAIDSVRRPGAHRYAENCDGGAKV